MWAPGLGAAPLSSTTLALQHAAPLHQPLLGQHFQYSKSFLKEKKRACAGGQNGQGHYYHSPPNPSRYA